jgi:hypothetical protein
MTRPLFGVVILYAVDILRSSNWHLCTCPKLARIIALISVALWLPTRAHCELEAMGLLPSESSEDGCGLPTEGCGDDACNLIEGQSFSFAKSGLQVPAPEIKLHECLSCLLAAISARDSPHCSGPAKTVSYQQYSYLTP